MRKNVAGQVIAAEMVSVEDGSAFTGTVTVYLTGDGGTQTIGSVGSGVCTYEGNGLHTYQPSQDETNYTHIAFTFVGSGAVPVTIQVYTNVDQQLVDIQSRIPATLDSGNIRASVQNSGIIADAVWEEPYNQHTTAGTFGKLMDILRKSNLTYDGTVNTSITPTTTSFSSNIDETTGAFNHAVLLFTSGNLTGENGVILSYENTDGTITLDEALTEAPADGDEFVIIAASHVHPVTEIQSGLATSAGVTAAFTEIKGATWSSATDTLEDIADTAAGGGVTVAPLQATAPNRVAGTQVVTYINDTSDIGPIAVTDSNGDAVDLSAYTLKVCVEQRDGTVLHNATPTVSGTGNNQITWTPNAASVATTDYKRWSLRVVSTGQVLALGDFIIDPAAKIST